jgi:23S rRNA pseudouridine1911/1915/1917 synthase
MVPAEDLPITILYQDASLAVVYKPAGMPTHPTTFRTSGTLVNALLYHIKDLSGIGGVLRPGIVHRLDRVTSGLLVVAKTGQAHESLSNQFQERLVKKTYRVLCLGRDPGPEGTIEGLIDRHPIRRIRMTIGDKGRTSLSHYTRIESHNPVYGLFFHPHTGRTHQIRVHLEKIGLWVVSDSLYGYDANRWPYPAFNSRMKDYPGIFLHAEHLEFEHPLSREPLSFTGQSPELFQTVWQHVFGKPAE